MAINIIPILQGADVVSQITINSETPFNIDNAIGMLCYIYNERNEIVAKFSLNDMVGHEDIDVVDAANGVFTVLLPKSLTITLSANSTLFAEVKTSVSKEDWSNGDFYTVTDNYYVGTVVASQTGSATP